MSSLEEIVKLLNGMPNLTRDTLSGKTYPIILRMENGQWLLGFDFQNAHPKDSEVKAYAQRIAEEYNDMLYYPYRKIGWKKSNTYQH